MYRFFRQSLYKRLILIILSCLVIPFLLVTIFLYQNILEDGDRSYRSNIELVTTQVQTQRKAHLDNVDTISNRIASNNALKGFLITGYSPYNWSYYANEVTQMVTGGLNYEQTYSPKLYCVNDTIPRGFSTFYRLSDINTVSQIADFLDSNQAEKWVTPEEGKDYQGAAFTEFRGHYTYLRKVDLQGDLLYLLTISISAQTMDEFLYENYKTIPNINHEVLHTPNYIFVNCSEEGLAETVVDKAYINTLKQGNGHVVDISFEEFPQSIIYFWPSNPQQKYMFYGIILFSLFGICSIAVVLRLVYKIFQSMFQCIQSFGDSIKSGLYTKLPVAGGDEIAQIKTAFNSLIDKIQNLMRLVEEQCTIVNESRFRMLQQQINPHFMYNTLEAFSYKMELYGHYGEADAMAAFSNMLRYNAGTCERYATVRDELEQVQSYLSIQKIKYADISIDVIIPEDLYDFEIPRFCLQPFVENSFIHGYCNRPLRISLSCVDLGEQVLVEICDNGKGIPSGKLRVINTLLSNTQQEKNETGIGLTNINTRLKLFYSEKYTVHLESEEGKWTLVTFQIPK